MKKKIFNTVFLLVLILCTMYFLLKDQEMTDLWKCFKNANWCYVLLGIVFILIFITFESWIIHYLLNSLSHKINIFHCIKYSFIGFFICAITPSATGGQPAQMYYMKQDGIPVSISSLVMVIVTAAYKGVLLILATVMLVFNCAFVMEHIKNIEIITIFGVLVNIVIICFLFMVVYKQSMAKKLIGNFFIFLGKKGLVKDYEEKTKKFLTSIRKYDNGAQFIKDNKIVVFNVFIITLFQRLAFLSVTFAVYKAFGLNGVNIFEIISLQLLISLAVDNLPLPGGMGANEGIFLLFFKEIFTPKYLTAGLLLTRGINYYFVILSGGLVMIFSKFMIRKHHKAELQSVINKIRKS